MIEKVLFYNLIHLVIFPPSFIFFFFLQSFLDLAVTLVFMFVAIFNKHDNMMDNSGILGFLECVFWENQISCGQFPFHLHII